MKKAIFLAVFIGFILPHVAMASWYNPFSWHIWNWFDKTEQPPITQTVEVQATTTEVATPINTTTATTSFSVKKVKVPTVKIITQTVYAPVVATPTPLVVPPVPVVSAPVVTTVVKATTSDATEFLKNMQASEDQVKQTEADRLKLERQQSLACVRATNLWGQYKDAQQFDLTSANGASEATKKAAGLNAKNIYENACNGTPLEASQICIYHRDTNSITCGTTSTCQSVDQNGNCISYN